MKLADLAEPLTELARPFATAVSALAVAIGVFVPWVTADKLWVAAGLAGASVVARSIDKRAALKSGAAGEPSQ